MSKVAEKMAEITDQQWEDVNQDNKDILDEFLLQGTLSPKTLNQYKSCLRIFFVFIKEKCKNLPIFELKPKHALLYQNFLISRGLSSSAVKLKRSAVSSLCGYIEVYYSDEYPLFRNIYNKKIPNPPKQAVHKKEPLTPDEFDLLIKTLEEREDWQKIAYLQFSYQSGCRRAESAQILKEVVGYPRLKDPRTGEEKKYYLTHEIRTKGKGIAGNVRKLQFTDVARDAMVKWLEARGEDDCPYLFVKKNKDGKTSQLGNEAFNYWCTDIFSEIIGRRMHPHLLRSSRATNLAIYEGKDIKGIQKLLSHASPDTTSLYIVNNNDDDLDDLF